MKLIKSVLIILSISVIGFFSCKKSKTDPSINSNISFKFNDTTKSADLIVSGYGKTKDTLQISGTVGQRGTIVLDIKNPKVGTFNITSGGLMLSYIPTSFDVNETYVASAGTVTITQLSSTSVSGTFNFSGTNKKEKSGVISDGSFQVLLPQ
ncbi:MAG: DUF6252 family protein [Mucilaginibacter sp.]